jgi:ABC-type multidrug transport system fused ATPase/permease subunit
VVLFVSPLSAIAILPVGIIYGYIGNRYIQSARELKRMDSMTRSPIYSHFSESIHGSTVIRAFACQKRFIEDLHKKVDINHQAFAMLWVANRWLNVRSSILGALITLSTTLAVVFDRGINAGAAGISIAYALSFADSLIWIVRMHGIFI